MLKLKQCSGINGGNPYVDRWAPQKPFATLVAAMVFLLLTAVVKGIMLVLSAVFVARISNRTVLDMRRIYFEKPWI